MTRPLSTTLAELEREAFALFRRIEQLDEQGGLPWSSEAGVRIAKLTSETLFHCLRDARHRQLEHEERKGARHA